MVQGDCGVRGGLVETKYKEFSRGAAKSEKPVLQERQRRKVEEKSKKSEQEDKFGSWGPIFKNREHFVHMHCC